MAGLFYIKPKYRIPLCIAIALHVALLLVLIIVVPKTHYRWKNQASQAAPVIHANAVDEKQLNVQIKRIKWEQAAKQRAQNKRLHDIEHRALLAKKRRATEQKRLHALRLQQAKLAKQRMAQEKALRQQKAQAKQARIQALAMQHKIKQMHQKQLSLKQAKLQQDLLHQQMQAEAQQLNTEKARLAKAHAAELRGMLDKYRAEILRAIENNWHPSMQNTQLFSQFMVHLGPGGVVTGVDLLKPSGSSALDQSARLAIYKSSPLPVPKDAALFDQFRQFRIKMSPQDIKGMSGDA